MDNQQEKINPEKSNGVFRESILLAKKSWLALRQDFSVIFFPSLFAIATVFFGAMIFAVHFMYAKGTSSPSSSLLFLVWFIVIFLSVFSKIGTTLMIRSRFQEKPITIKEAFKKTAVKTNLIFTWSLLSSMILSVLIILSVDIYSSFISGILVIYWGLATYFIVPAMAEETKNLSEAIFQSVEALKRRWKEMLVLNILLECALAIIAIPTIAVLSLFAFSMPLFIAIDSSLAFTALFFIALLKILLILLAFFEFLFRTSFTLALYSKNNIPFEEVAVEKAVIQKVAVVSPPKRQPRKKIVAK